jgi:putative transposase
MSQSARSAYAGYRFPPEIISHAVWLYFRFPLCLRMVEDVPMSTDGPLWS